MPRLAHQRCEPSASLARGRPVRNISLQICIIHLLREPCHAIAHGGVKGGGRSSTTESLQANHWLPPRTTVVAGRKMLPFQLIKFCQNPGFFFIFIALEHLLESRDRSTN